MMLSKKALVEHTFLLPLLLRIFDACAIWLAGLLAYFVKFGTLAIALPYFLALLLGVILSLIVFQGFAIYHSTRVTRFSIYIQKLALAVCTVLLLLAGLAFLTKSGDVYSRVWFALWLGCSLLLLVTYRCGLLWLLHSMRARGWNERRVIIFGAGNLSERLLASLQQSLWCGFRVIAILDDDLTDKPVAIAGVPVIAAPEDLSQYLKEVGTVHEIWLTLPLRAEKRVKGILHELRHDTVTTRLILDVIGMDVINHSVSNLLGFPALNIRSTPMVGVNRMIKAIEDRLLSAIILLLISPLLGVIALAVKLSSPGPVFYRQKRVSWNGKEFEMLKFRTMPVDAEAKTGAVWAKAGEQRATRVGAILRRTSLDELPQFINVLIGDMSIVGPRPERLVFVEEFKNKIPGYMQKHLVKAGITGWAQVNGWRGNTSLEKRIEYDLYYIENWSLTFDLKIIILTLFRGFIHKNAY